ncbi:MAG: tRNA threonylcarbamoyladenosine dehydratase [Kiritimatiellae bacterium]|nr:tRNA threonylcarbamoyladenosine dehydratase [Kiritimatiellia bacterium]
MNKCIHNRTIDLIGADALQILRSSRVAIFGLGGVGSFAAEALARVGIGSLILIDKDIVEQSNINRQLIALNSTLNRPKVDVMAERINDINPEIVVVKRHEFYLPKSSSQFKLQDYDYVVDAIDTVTAKVELARQCQTSGTSLISCMGTGNKLDPTQFMVADIFDTTICPLCKVMRKELKRCKVTALKVVYSQEEPTKLKRTPGSISFVPPAAGLIMASVVVKDLISN